MKKTWQGIKQLISLNNKTGLQIKQIYHRVNTLIQIMAWLIISITFSQILGLN